MQKLALIALFILTPLVSMAEPLKFPVTTIDGQQVNLGNQIGKGKWVLVMFWATDCPICKTQEPTISAFHEAHSGIDAEVIGVSIDGPDNLDVVKKYLKENDLSYPNYVTDVLGASFSYAGIAQNQFVGTPTYLLFNPEGKLLGDNPGPMRLEALEAFIERNS